MNGMLLKQSCDKKNTGALEKTRKFRKTTLLVLEAPGNFSTNLFQNV
jgi:hypothetical protein